MSVVLHIQDHGSWACNPFESLLDDDEICIVKEIGNSILWIVFDGSNVQGKLDHNNAARTIEAPLVMPPELVKMRTDAFISDVLDPFRRHLEKFWSVEHTDKN